MNAETERRLRMKLEASVEGDEGVQRRLMLEGAAGLWDLATQVGASLASDMQKETRGCFEALASGLQSEMA
eukprot:scaffold168005_cov25-Prasinocladus_malaysianus.AAC.1